MSFSTEEARLKDIKSYPSLEAEAEVKVEKGAIAYFENQVREKPEDAFAYAYLGYLYSVKEAFDIEDEADKKEFLKAMGLNSHYAPFHYRLALVESDKNKKRMSLEKALAIDPEHAKSYFRLGRYYYGRDNYQEAEDQFKEALKINPHYLNSRLYLAFIYSYRGWDKEAASELEKIIKLAPHYAPAHSELADCLEKWDMLREALAEYETALSLDFTRGYSREKLIDLYAYLRDEQKMKEEYKNLIELNPYDINPYLEMAKIYEGLDDYEMAIAQCE
ncbi:MAG: tetratricopeptide repeat protein, partial [Candidatus Aminicenantes bacterium]|nr:tetratricopeptide repeat protein [Candidatus Aminicenantes bacterium]